MKKISSWLALIGTIGCVFSLASCSSEFEYTPESGETTDTIETSTDTQIGYKVKFAENYQIVDDLKDTYLPGEKVTVKLETITEHYYELYVNGLKQDMDREASDLSFTYFTFTMPSEDVVIKIEDRWVDIPEAP